MITKDKIMPISKQLTKRLICPVTKDRLELKNNRLVNTVNPSINYPILDSIPVLINDNNSLFSINDFESHRNTTCKNSTSGFLKKLLPSPSISNNIKAKANYKKLNTLLPDQAKILIIGGSVIGEGLDIIIGNPSFDIIQSDVTFGPQTTLICDAHDLPFESETFDCVIIQAVLEHVLDPNQCVSEICRVLASKGVVYAETPFIQQVHMGQYDFTRFTHLGHRWLFKSFQEISSGPCCGPGMALAWSYKHFLQSFFKPSSIFKKFFGYFATITSFHLKIFDYLIIDNPNSYDAASGYFFMGHKSDTEITYKELLNSYEGVM